LKRTEEIGYCNCAFVCIGVKLVSCRKERKVEDVWKQGAEIIEAENTGNAEREKIV
jgi:hypothetical protein